MQDKHAWLVPKLRFPEFRDTGEWENKLLGALSHVVAGQSPKGTNINSLGDGAPFFQGKTDFGDIFLRKPTKWTTQVTKLAKPGDILLSVRAPVGALNITSVKICIGRGLASLQPKCNKWFLYYSLLAQQSNIVGSGGSVYDSINREQIEKLRIIVPPANQEQKKIADCLGSLDDIIEATNQKLEALQKHKKGLMQQLFPQSGETVPRLRFPEFQDVSKWEELKLGKLLNIHYGKDHKFLEEGEIPVLGTGGVMRHVNKALSKGPAILIGRKGTINKPIFIRVPFWAVDTLFYCIPNKTIEPSFLFCIIQQINWLKYNEATGVPSLNVNVIHNTTVKTTFNLNEQKRIADCLGSLDDIIESTGQKLEALRQHKKGLLQQLFPPLRNQ
ncbi:MAG: restriction endonuclease subunit S [Rhodobacteraceae bacterium]|nr:restriction endonuclease subunit S [Paracoccaceae bacterium]